MITFGYARVSTTDQNADRQLAVLKHCDHVFTDKASGKSIDRPELNKLIAKLRSGDRLEVKSIDRLARNTKELLTLVEQLTNEGVIIRFLDNNMTFDNSPSSKLILTMMGAVAEFERNMIRQRQAEGIECAKARGAFKGRAVNTELHNNIKHYLTRGMKAAEVAKLCECSLPTVYKIKKEIGI